MRLPRLPHIALHHLGVILLIELLVLLAIVHRPPPRPQIASSNRAEMHLSDWAPDMNWPTVNATPGTPWPTLGPLDEQGYVQVINNDNLYSAQEQAAMAGELEQVLAYVAQRFGSEPRGRILAYVEQDPHCVLNGLAETEWRSVHVYTCDDISRERAVNILAHEFVHQLASDYYGPQHLQADLMLSEGVATWGAGQYWLGGRPDFAAFVREHYMEDLFPLATHYEGRPLHEMNQLYYQWASFVEYLLAHYGRDAFDKLYTSGKKEPGSAAYYAVYGKDLPTLEQEWRAWLEE
jgi:hypothetical protein